MRRVLFHVQHLLGTGHLHRSLRLARGLAGRGVEVRLLSGGAPVPSANVKDITLVQLSPCGVANAEYQTLLDAQGQPVNSAWKHARRAHVLSELESFRPHLVITETYPFGRGLLRFELAALVDAVRRRVPRPILLSSVRDIIEPRLDPRKNLRMLEHSADFDGIMVHSDPSVVPLDLSFPLTHRLPVPLYYTGYITPDDEEGCEILEAAATPALKSAMAGSILVSAGGGAVGGRLLEVAAAAARTSAYHWHILVPRGFDPTFLRTLADIGGAQAQVEWNRKDFPFLLRRARLSISQAGYNTLVESVAAGARALVVPFVEHGEREQSLRAEQFASKLLLSVLDPEKLEPQSLGYAVETALVRPRSKLRVRTDGVAESVARVLALLEDGEGG